MIPTGKRKMHLGRLIKGILFGLWLLITSTLGIVFFHCVPYLFVLVFLHPKLYRKLADAMIGSWLIYCAALLEIFLGIKIVVTGDKIRPSESKLILMNHRTRLDWLYFWSVLVRQSGVTTEKIILKEPLKHIPGAGWAMQVAGFIFVKRKWEHDKKVFTKMINYFSGLKYKSQVLLFPEGTDLTLRSKTQSDSFAKKNDLASYDYCLHPRTTGFTFLAQHMKEKEQLDAVYDVTIAYPANFPQTEPELLTGNFPKEVHFHIRRHDESNMPVTENELQEWCQSQWQSKEERLKKFYDDKYFSSDLDSGDNETRKIEAQSASPVPLVLKITFVYWTLFVIGVTILLWYSSVTRWCFLLQIAFYLFMGHKRGGFELFLADYFNWFFKSKT